ncbi:transcriptional repressor [Candidatus Poribacteria bacterium]|nr:transcriptional repressor [Candidatus Poribacteria bacterium]
METEMDIFNKYLDQKKLKKTIPRETILKIFLSTERHISVDEFYDIVRAQDPLIGHSTIYRTLKLLCECQLAREITLSARKKYFEHSFQHEHHDHFVCNKCGESIEFLNEELEGIQDKVSKKYGFAPEHHRLTIYGTCKKCKKECKKEK